MKYPLIAIKGYKYWEEVIYQLLTDCGYRAYILLNRRGDKRFFSKTRIINFVYIFLNKKWFSSTDIFLIGFERALFLRIALFFRKRIVIFWIGTDVLELQKIDQDLLTKYKHPRVTHFAITTEIICELADLGIKSELLEIVSDQVFPREQYSLPDKPGILSYWSNQRKEFYGGDIVIQLANMFPHIQFYILGDTDHDHSKLPNICHINYIEDIDDLYKKISILIRITKHDGLPSMILELLARGRWVIWSKNFPGTVKATNFKEARLALIKLLNEKGLNKTGIAYVRDNYSTNILKERALKIFTRQFGTSVNE
jgi:hypothetical protein